jgi:hypothetical protein
MVLSTGSAGIVLLRLPSTPTATFGVLVQDDKPICLTLELPWRDNQHDVSCIPAGDYPLTWDLFNNVEHLLVGGVPNRSGIFIHAANKPSELRGCIAPGTSFLPAGVGIGQSRDALLLLHNALRNIVPTILQVRWASATLELPGSGKL